MPDYNPAIAAGIQPAPGLDFGKTLSTVADYQRAQAATQLTQLQALQQQRDYNALQAASQAYANNQDPVPAALRAGLDPTKATALQNLFASQRAMSQTPGGILPQAYQELTGARRNLAETAKLGAETQGVNIGNAAKIAAPVIANPADDGAWNTAVNAHYKAVGGSNLEKQQLLAIKDPATRARIAQQYSLQGASPDEMNKVTAQEPGVSYTTPARILAGSSSPQAAGQSGAQAPAVQGLTPQQLELQKQTASKTVDYLQGDGNKKYSNAQALMGSMVNIDHDIETLGPGWMGAGAELKGNFAKGWNSLVDTIPGLDPKAAASAKFDPTKVSSWEEFNKEQIRAGMQLINSNFGGSREAASIVQMGKTANAGVSNSYLGAKYVSSTIKAAAQREIDLYEYQAQHPNQLPGISAVQFNKDHPPQDYAMRGITNVIPQAAIAHLKSQPNLAKQFDNQFGSGTAEFILGQK